MMLMIHCVCVCVCGRERAIRVVGAQFLVVVSEAGVFFSEPGLEFLVLFSRLLSLGRRILIIVQAHMQERTLGASRTTVQKR